MYVCELTFEEAQIFRHLMTQELFKTYILSVVEGKLKLSLCLIKHYATKT